MLGGKMQNVIFSLILLVIGIATGLFIQRLKSNSQLSLLEIKLKEEQKQEHELKLTEVNNQLRSRELEAEGLKKDIQHFSTLKGDLGKLQQEANVLLEENADRKSVV